MADIEFENMGYVNYHAGDDSQGTGWSSYSPDALATVFDKYVLNEANTDYHTDPDYTVSNGYIHVNLAEQGIDADALEGFYSGVMTTTDLLTLMPDVGMYYFVYRVFADDRSGCYVKLTLAEKIYTGASLDILQLVRITIEKGMFTDYTDASSYTPIGTTTSMTLDAEEYMNVPGRIYFGYAYAPMGQSGLPVFFLSVVGVTSSGVIPSQSASIVYPAASDLPLSFSQEWYPENGWYGAAQIDTTSTGAFYGGAHVSISGSCYFEFNMSKLCRDNNTTIIPLYESPEVGPEAEPGGNEPHERDDTSDPIEVPDDPLIGVSDVGFVRVYKTGSQSLQDMGVELFPPLAYSAPTAITGTDVTDAVVNGFNSLVTFLANVPSFFDQIMANTLINYVIDCHIIPVSPSGGSSEGIKVGYKTLTATGERIYNDYVNFSCGSISLAEYYTNFADFTCTSAKLYLPFVGFVPVQPEWFQADTLRVDYKFNVIDGSFACYVRSGGRYVNNGDSGGTIVGQYAGNACIHLPITGVTYSNMAAGLVGAGAGMAVGAASGNLAAAATSAINAAGSHGDIAQSNAYNGSAAFLGCRYPFLIIERPVSSYARNYQHEIGIPSNIYAKLSQLSGFVKMENVHVDGITGATDEEKEEIRRLLASGVIV